MNKAFKLSFVILGMWLGMTCLIDFVAVPAVFRNVSSRQEAGSLGMIIFNTFNYVEVVFALIFSGLTFVYKDKVKWKKTYVGISIFLVILSCVYAFYMSPRITEVNTKKWELVEDSEEYRVLDQEHQFLHKTFRKTDSIKILILLFLIGAGVARKEEDEKELSEGKVS